MANSMGVLHGFNLSWLLCVGSAAVLLTFAARATGTGYLSVLIDSRGRYSLNRFQFVLWSALILSALAAHVLANGLGDLISIDRELLVLAGISTVSVAAAGAVKHSKNLASRTASMETAALEALAERTGRPEFGLEAARLSAQPKIQTAETAPPAHLLQLFLEEEGDLADQIICVTKFQNLVLTILAAIAFAFQVAESGSLLPAQPNQGGVLSPDFLWLLGISHAGYVGGKLPNKC